jgi:hypothetical protein
LVKSKGSTVKFWFKEYLKLFHQLDKSKPQTAPLKTDTDESIIKLCIKNEYQIFDTYSVSEKDTSVCGKTSRINNEILEYLKREIDREPLHTKIVVEVEMPKITDEVVGVIKGMVTNTIKVTINELSKENMRLKITSLLLAAGGIVTLALLHLLPSIINKYALHEFFVIISWVFIWRSVELFFFRRSEIKLTTIKLIQLYIAEYRRNTKI